MNDVERNGRQRIISWDDPVPAAEAGAALSGLEHLRALRDGRIPLAPIMELLCFQLVEVDEGRVVFAALPAEYHYNPFSLVHGGFAATLLDSAMGCAVHTTLPAGKGYTTVDLDIRLVRAITSRVGKLRCEAKIIHSGGSIATAEGRVTDEAGTLYAHGTTTCLVLTPR